VGSLAGAVGALAAGLPQLLDAASALSLKAAVQAMFVLYAALGLAVLFLYRRLALPEGDGCRPAGGPLGPSRRLVLALAALFSLDSFGGGFFVQSILALWLFDHFDLSLTTAAAIFFWSGVLTAFSYLVAVRIAGRFGLVNTMVWTHLPANLCIMLMPFCTALWAALVLLFIRSVLSQMDVPTRTSYVMAVVTPEERAATASITAVPRSLASAVSPLLAGWLLTLSSFGWPLLIGGALKAVYDLLLWVGFHDIRPPEEAVSRQLSAVSCSSRGGQMPPSRPSPAGGRRRKS
jgi:predicted MFS family arabinose efflux permease